MSLAGQLRALQRAISMPWPTRTYVHQVINCPVSLTDEQLAEFKARWEAAMREVPEELPKIIDGLQRDCEESAFVQERPLNMREIRRAVDGPDV